MEYCSKCGAEVIGSFCTNCGTSAAVEVSSKTNHAGAQRGPSGANRGTSAAVEVSSKTNPAGVQGGPSGANRPSGSYYGQPGPNRGPYSANGGPSGANSFYGANLPTYHLGWHKFLIYFGLWASGIITILGSIYNMVSIADPYVVAAFAWLGISTAPFILLSTLSLIAGAFVIFVRFRLAQFRKDAPKLLLISIGIIAALNLIWTIYFATSPFFTITFATVAQLAWSVVLISANWRYYSSREELFVN